MRAVGLDPEHDEAARFGSLDAALDRAREASLVADHVVGRGEQHERVLVLARGDQGGDAGRRRRVAALRLDHDPACGAPISSSWSATRKRWR